ncbi:hypothetical protein BOX15_Mlig024234g1, partial [Macrostomum lignano]
AMGLDQRPNFAGSLLLTVEFYHTISHLFILFRFRLLPRRDLVRVRAYFLADTLTVFLAWLYIGRVYWWQDLYTAAQVAQHLYYFTTWESGFFARRVVSWSSLDWQKSGEQRRKFAWFEILGTSFDIAVHLTNAFLLVQLVTSVEVILCLALTQCMVLLVLFNPMLAWASPACIPDWVRRRLAPIPNSAPAN